MNDDAHRPDARPITDQLRDNILTGRYEPLTMLTGEHDLAWQLHVNRGSLRTAAAALVGEGLLRLVRGRGTQVLPWVFEGSFDLLKHLMRLRRRGPEGAALMQQLLWLRHAIYVQSTPLLMTATPDLEHLRYEVANMRDGVHWREVPVLLRAEERVLCVLIQQTGNLPLIMLAHAIRRTLYSVLPKCGMQDLSASQERFSELIDAVERKDAGKTTALLSELCRARDEVYLELVTPAPSTASPAH